MESLHDFDAYSIVGACPQTAGWPTPPSDHINPPARTASSPAARLSADAQWAKIAAVLSDAIYRVKTICRLQATAAEQIDAANYALRTLREDLAPLLAAGAARGPVVLYVPEPLPRFKPSEDIAA